MQNKPKLNLPFGLLMCSIILLSLFLTNSFNPNGNRTTTPSEAIIISPKPFTSNKSLEIHTLALITVTPTPTFPPNSSSSSSGGSATGNPLADLAIKTMNTLRASCGSVVNQGNVSCVRAVTPSSVADRLALNVSEDISLQCAGFVQAIAIGVNAPVGDGDASTYVGRQISGYQWIPNTASAIMVPGDIPVWSGAGCQHIAVVTQVYGNYAFQVAEANGDNGTIDFMQYGRNSFCVLQGWQHKL